MEVVVEDVDFLDSEEGLGHYSSSIPR